MKKKDDVWVVQGWRSAYDLFETLGIYTSKEAACALAEQWCAEYWPQEHKRIRESIVGDIEYVVGSGLNACIAARISRWTLNTALWWMRNKGEERHDKNRVD